MPPVLMQNQLSMKIVFMANMPPAQLWFFPGALLRQRTLMMQNRVEFTAATKCCNSKMQRLPH